MPLVATEQNGLDSSDYSGLPNSITVSAGNSSASFSLSIVDDALDDDGETLLVSFGSLPRGIFEGTPATATIGIQDNDEPPPLVILWEATLTVGNHGGYYGYGTSTSGGPPGSLPDRDFDWQGITFSVDQLLLNPYS